MFSATAYLPKKPSNVAIPGSRRESLSNLERFNRLFVTDNFTELDKAEHSHDVVLYGMRNEGQLYFTSHLDFRRWWIGGLALENKGFVEVVRSVWLGRTDRPIDLEALRAGKSLDEIISERLVEDIVQDVKDYLKNSDMTDPLEIDRRRKKYEHHTPLNFVSHLKRNFEHSAYKYALVLALAHGEELPQIPERIGFAGQEGLVITAEELEEIVEQIRVKK